jgi:hypothetical protein
MCEIVILAHIWDAFGFLRKNGCDSGGTAEEQGCSGKRAAKESEKRAAKASGESGGGGGESADVLDLSSKETNMSPEELRVISC